MLASTPLAPGHRSWGPTPKVTNSGIKMQSETPKLTCRERGTSNSIKQAKTKKKQQCKNIQKRQSQVNRVTQHADGTNSPLKYREPPVLQGHRHRPAALTAFSPGPRMPLGCPVPGPPLPRTGLARDGFRCTPELNEALVAE